MATSILAAIVYAQQLSQTDSNGIPSVLGLAFANDAQNDFIRELSARNINASKLTFSPASVLLANTTSFKWPDALYHLKTLEINYSDTGQQNYIQAENVEISNAQGVSFDKLRVNQPAWRPLFANYGDTWEVFPTPTTSANAKFVYFTLPTEYPDVGSPVTYPATLDYRILGAKIAELYALSQSAFAEATAFNEEYNKRVNKVVTMLMPASQQPVTAEPLHISGWEF